MTSINECLLTTDQACALQIWNSRSLIRALRAPTSSWVGLPWAWRRSSRTWTGVQWGLGQKYCKFDHKWVTGQILSWTYLQQCHNWLGQVWLLSGEGIRLELFPALYESEKWNFSLPFSGDKTWSYLWPWCWQLQLPWQKKSVSIVLHMLVLFHSCFSSHQRPIETWAQVYKYLFAIFARYINHLWSL